MILSREQIEARRRNDNGDLVDTALAYHDLRDAVRTLAEEWYAGDWDGESVAFGRRLRSLVARVERGES